MFSALGGADYYAHKTPERVRLDIGQERWDASFKFTFIRNPWDHAVSYYESTKGQLRSAPTKIPCATFGEWVLGGMEPFPMRDWTVDGELSNPLLQEQYIKDDMFVGRFENLQQDFDYVCRQINKDPVLLPHLNASEKRDYRDYYQNSEVKRIVTICNQSTIDAFGYTF